MRLLVAATIAQGVELIGLELPDAVLIQMDLGNATLGNTIQRVQSRTNAPLLVLGRAGGGAQANTALELGADGFVNLETNPAEIGARIFALIRRERPQLVAGSRAPPAGGQITMDALAHEVDMGGRKIRLTPTEYRLLDFLVRNRGSVLTHEEIERDVWGGAISAQAIRKYVGQLRKKLADNARDSKWIVTVIRAGYSYIGPPTGP